MMEYLAGKHMSLFCFFINCIFAVSAYMANNGLWFCLSFSLAMVCLHNYNKAKDLDE